MKRYFLETSAIINYLRDDPKTVQGIDNLDGELVSSFICLAELYEGIARARERERVEQGVKDFFFGLSEIYGLDHEIAKQFGFLRATLKQAGQIIEDLDILIAATCLAYQLTLVTNNPKHFQRIKALEVVTL